MPDAALTQALRTVTLGEPQVWHGLTVFPLMAADERPPAWDSFGMAHSAGAFLITEVSESGTVGQLRAENSGSRPVLLLDGEEVIGAKQNRIINLTILVPAHTTMTIPVTCVEQGRWSLQSKTFSESGRAMFADGRARKMRDVTRSMRERGGAAADQGAVWSSVAERLDMNRASSPTGAMSAMYEQGRAGIDGYVAALAPLPLQVGAVFGMNGRIVGAELFDSAASYAVSAPKIIRSYAVQHSGDGAAPVPETEASAFIARLCSVEPTEHSPPGAGRQLRFEEGDTIGAALVHEDRMVHLAAFRVEDAAPPPSRARELIRHGIMRCEDGAVFGRTPERHAVDKQQLRDRVEGMLLGLAIGDALGNRSESMNPTQRRAMHGEIRDYLPNPHAGNRSVGLPSDDTQMAFWTLRRLVHDGGLDPERLAREFCSHPIFGIGQTVRAFIRAFKDQRRPWQQAGQHSAGNGALMRIAPVLLPHLRSPSPALWDDAAVAGMVTHNEPASIGACVAFIDVLWQCLGMTAPPERGWWLRTFTRTMAQVEGDVVRYEPRTPTLRGASPVASFTARHVGAALEQDLDTAAACDGWYSGAYLLETVPSVLCILERHAHDPEEAIVRAVNDTRDNDTVAAIVGVAVGALHGRAALPERWVSGLLGRTGASDDGEVFRLIDVACTRFVGG